MFSSITDFATSHIYNAMHFAFSNNTSIFHSFCIVYRTVIMIYFINTQIFYFSRVKNYSII